MAAAAEKLASNMNFGAFGKATELRNRLLFTLGALIVFRLGTFLPIPGINPMALQQFFQQQASGILGVFDYFFWWRPSKNGYFCSRCDALYFFINHYDVDAGKHSSSKST